MNENNSQLVFQGALRPTLFKLAVFSLVGVGWTGVVAQPWVLRETFLMGTTLAISVSSPTRAAGLQAIDSAFSAVRRVDDILNDWRSDTDLSRLNRAMPGAPFDLAPDLLEYLVEVEEWTRRSGGAFDPGIGALVDAWDLRGKGSIPGDDALDAARASSGLIHYQLSVSSHSARRPDSASWIDAGGFGKGAALRAAQNQLRSLGVEGAILNFGGQVVVLGDTTLDVDVADPRQRFRPVARLRVTNASVSTTSQSERFLDVGGRRLGHVLDPRTGVPVLNWGSVTVVHPDPMIADILSTALFVMGPEAGVPWCETHGIAALFLIARADAVHAVTSPPMLPLLVSQPSLRGL